MEKIKIYKAKLKTANKTDEQIKAVYDDEVSQEEIESYRKTFNSVDNLEILVVDSAFEKGSYVIVGWDPKDDDRWRDFMYEVEQDAFFGTYVDEREEFLNDWNNGEYEPSGSITFSKDDLEILEQIN